MWPPSCFAAVRVFHVLCCDVFFVYSCVVRRDGDGPFTQSTNSYRLQCGLVVEVFIVSFNACRAVAGW